MATFDQLSAEQRAIIELVLRQGKTYAELAEMLGMPEDRVRTLARDSLAELAPVTARDVDADWRAQLADYVLGQQAGPEVTATRGHLRRSEPARAWTRSLLDSLDNLYPNGLPEIPHGARGRIGGGGATGGEPLSPAAQAVVRRRRLIAAGAGLVALLLIVLVWPIGLLTGGSDDDGSSGDASTTAQQNAQAGQPAGVAIVALQDGKYHLILQATNLPALKRRQAYEVWLYNSRGDAKSLGAQVLDQNGGFRGQSQALSREELERYRAVDVSLEPVDSNRAHSGTSVLRGNLTPLRDAQPQQGKAAVVSNALLKPPRG
jgi:anti-sigma-K factor RskA/sigma-70-like protein